MIDYALKQKIAAPVMSAAMSDLLYKLEFVNSAHEEIHITLAFSFSSPGRPDIL